jgi:polar amino acid transport system substrate-binding protein
MSPKALGLTSWEDLRGKPVCGKQGAFYNQIVEERYGAQVIAFTGNAEAKQALRDKKCIAWVYDDSSIGSDLSSGEWDEFEMPLNSEDDNPWALGCSIGRA